ncbi:MAG: LysE family translocator [Trueperaceae bacterium]
MSESASLAVYVLASLALLAVPGPSVLYVVALSLRQGRVAGLASVAGVGAGAFLHFTAAALGLAGLLAASATAFTVVKWAGAAYLAFLGLRTLLAREAEGAPPRIPAPRSLGRIAAQGVLVTLLNPKMALFVLAFVPQFVDPARGGVAGQVLLLGGIFCGMAAVTDSMYALSAGWLGGLMRRSAAAVRMQRWITGGIYLGLGVLAAASGPHGAASSSTS